MGRKVSGMGLGAALVLLSVVVFGGCPQSGDGGGDTGIEVTIGNVTVTNIPEMVGTSASYKVFIQISTGSDASAGYVAKGGVTIDAKTSGGFFKPDGTAWTADTTAYNVAVVISPLVVTTWEDIVMYGAQNKPFSSAQTFNLNSGFILLNTMAPNSVKAVFDGEGTNPKQPGIICVPESGIDYPGKP
jgi:hypothetical protein